MKYELFASTFYSEHFRENPRPDKSITYSGMLSSSACPLCWSHGRCAADADGLDHCIAVWQPLSHSVLMQHPLCWKLVFLAWMWVLKEPLRTVSSHTSFSVPSILWKNFYMKFPSELLQQPQMSMSGVASPWYLWLLLILPYDALCHALRLHRLVLDVHLLHCEWYWPFVYKSFSLRWGAWQQH